MPGTPLAGPAALSPQWPQARGMSLRPPFTSTGRPTEQDDSASVWQEDVARRRYAEVEAHDVALREMRTNAAWKPYLDLLSHIPGGTVVDCVVGAVWTSILNSDGRVGVSLTTLQGVDESILQGSIAGVGLLTAARWLLSWNSYEAAVGCAAVNSVLNTEENAECLSDRRLSEIAVRGTTVFERIARQFAGGKVAVVGHFPVLKAISDMCQLIVLERDPQRGDLPDPACEYVLGEQDCVCITGTAVANKTLPRLLELSQNAYIVLVGPSVPLSPVWFDYGVDLLAGAVVTDPEGVRRCVREGAHRRAFREGLTTVAISAECAK